MPAKKTPNEIKADNVEKVKDQAKITQAGIPKTDAELIAAKAADNDAKSDDRFRKAYVLKSRDWKAAQATDDGSQLHENNRLDVLQQALNAGLHAQEQAQFDGAEDQGDKSTRLNYSVLVKVASEDSKAHEAVVPSSVLKDTPGGTTVQADQKQK